tara:strand:- start:2415 stop:3650 length:1236 start_codon:yes stop_codon:yes gene_type:complete
VKKESEKILVGLDIGTSKIVAIVAKINDENDLTVIGIGQAESKGLKKGVVINIDSTVNSIRAAVEEAELMSDCKIETVTTGIAGSHIRSFNSTGMVAIRDAEVSQNDVDRVIETATAINIPSDQQILHVIPQEFIIDGQEDIKEPIGMSGRRLEVRAHIVTGAISAAQNIIKCIKRCGISVSDLVLQPLASSNSILTEDEKNLGTLLIDIGGGTTDIAIFSGGAIRHTAVIPIAGDQITSDIAMALRASTNEAEAIKLTHGVCKQSLVEKRTEFEVAGLGDRAQNRLLSKNTLAAVIEPRVEELFSLVSQVSRESGFDELISSGVVLTGGSSLLVGVVELAEDVFFRQVRVANPNYSGNLADVISNPRYSTAMGLIIEANRDLSRFEPDVFDSNSWLEVLRKMKSWFVGNF